MCGQGVALKAVEVLATGKLADGIEAQLQAELPMELMVQRLDAQLALAAGRWCGFVPRPQAPSNQANGAPATSVGKAVDARHFLENAHRQIISKLILINTDGISLFFVTAIPV